MNLIAKLLRDVLNTSAVSLEILGARAKEIEEIESLNSMLNESLDIEFEPFVCIQQHIGGITGHVISRGTTALQLKNSLMLAGLKFRAKKSSFCGDTAISFHLENYQIPVLVTQGCLEFISTEMTYLGADETPEKKQIGEFAATKSGVSTGNLH